MKDKYSWLKNTTVASNTVRSNVHYISFFPVFIFGIVVCCLPWLFPYQDPEMLLPEEAVISISFFFGGVLLVLALNQVYCYELTPTALVKHSLLRDKTHHWDEFQEIIVVKCLQTSCSTAQGALLSKRDVAHELTWAQVRPNSSNELWLIGIQLQTPESYEETKWSACFDKRVFISYLKCHGINVEDRTSS